MKNKNGFLITPSRRAGSSKKCIMEKHLANNMLKCWCDWWKTISDCSVTRAWREFCWERLSLADGLNTIMNGLKVWHWGLCIVYLYPWSEGVKKQISLEHKEVDVSNKRHARIRIWAFAWNESYCSLFFRGTALLGCFVVGLVPTQKTSQTE